MQRFKNILVFSDCGLRSRAALGRAIELAGRNNAKVTVLNVLESMPCELDRLSAAGDASDLWELALRERRQRLDRFIVRTGGSPVRLTAKVRIGSPFIEVIKEVIQHKHDLVMMVAEGDGGIEDFLFGSTSTHLMRKCPCPVWVVNSKRAKRYSKVLAAVNSAPSGDDHNGLNIKILELAAGLAKLEGSEFHVIHAWAPVSQWLKVAGLRTTKSKLAEIDRSDEESHSNWLDVLLQKIPLGDLKVHWHLLKGDPRELIPELARAKSIDVIVMGTVSRLGVPGLFIGNTAEKVLQHVRCSVLTVKPDGFVTPVKL